MAWKDISKESLIRDLGFLVHDTVSHFRARGHKSEHAIEQAALALGMTPRRTRAFYYGEAFSIGVDEYRAAKERFLRHLDQQAADLSRRAEAARNRRRQMEMLL